MGSDVYGLPSRETYPDSQNKCSDAAKIRIISLPSKQISIYFIFFPYKSLLFQKIVVSLYSDSNKNVKLNNLNFNTLSYHRHLTLLIILYVPQIVSNLRHITIPQTLWKQFFQISSLNIWKFQEFSLSLHLTQLVRKGERVKTC
jgi:hypothetical protein